VKIYYIFAENLSDEWFFVKILFLLFHIASNIGIVIVHNILFVCGWTLYGNSIYIVERFNGIHLV